MGVLREKFWFWAGVIPAVVVVVDQASKYWAIKKFHAPHNICAIDPRPELQIEVSPVFDLALVCNQGVSFGMMSSASLITRIGLTTFAAAMCVFLLVWLNRERGRLLSWALALIIGGAIGNGIDRALYGAVTDFLNFSDIGFKWVFNVADSAITAGVIGMMLSMILQPKPAPKIDETP